MPDEMGIHPRDASTKDEHIRAVERVLQAWRDTGKLPGFAGSSPEHASALARQGFRFITAGSDLGFMLGGAADGLRVMRSGWQSAKAARSGQPGSGGDKA